MGKKNRNKHSSRRPDAAFWDSLHASGGEQPVKPEEESPGAEANKAEAAEAVEAKIEETAPATEVNPEKGAAAAETGLNEIAPKSELKEDAAPEVGGKADDDVSEASAKPQEPAAQPEKGSTSEKAETDHASEAEDWRDTLAYLETEEKQAEKERVKKQAGKKGKRDRKRKVRNTILLLALLAGLIAAFLLYRRFAPSTTRMESKAYFEWMIAREQGTEAENVSLAEGELAVLMDEKVLSGTAWVSDEKVYLSYDLVLENIFTRFYWDTSLERMLFTTADDTWQIPLNSASYTTKDGTETYEVPIFITRNDSTYICADFLAQYANMTYEVWPEAYHVLVTHTWGERLAAEAGRSTPVRFGSSSKQDIVTQLQKGEQVFVLDNAAEKWLRVLTPDGYIGWAPRSAFSEPETVTTSHDYTQADYATGLRDQKINLVWHQISSTDGNKFFASDTAGMTGVNVISPTWFSLTDNEGNFSSYAEKSYVRKAHNKGLEVWGLVDNFSANMSTAELTANASARAALIRNLINAALEVGMDGINIDFETISEAAGHSYVQFMRELSVECRANNLVLSVDVPVPTVYSTQYDRSELGVFCDYVIMMGYDEHYSGSEAGSVASLSFEENGIQDSLEELPAKKLVSAVPFYTRLWYTLETSEGSSTWSDAYGMNTIATTIDTYNVETVWNDETKQNYAEWTLDDGTLCRIWVEDEESLALKADLVKTYELGGIAAWALGFERSSIWSVLSEHIGD